MRKDQVDIEQKRNSIKKDIFNEINSKKEGINNVLRHTRYES